MLILETSVNLQTQCGCRKHDSKSKSSLSVVKSKVPIIAPQSEPHPTLLTLPHELQAQICLALPHASLIALAATCRTLAPIALSVAWKDTTLQVSHRVSRRVRRYQTVVSVEECLEWVENTTGGKFASRFLKGLDLGRRAISHTELAKLLQTFPHLRHLALARIKTPRWVNETPGRYIMQNTLSSIPTLCPLLRHLVISRQSAHTYARGIASIVPHLKSLELHSCDFEEPEMDAIFAQGAKLEHVTVFDAKAFDDYRVSVAQGGGVLGAGTGTGFEENYDGEVGREGTVSIGSEGGMGPDAGVVGGNDSGDSDDSNASTLKPTTTSRETPSDPIQPYKNWLTSILLTSTTLRSLTLCGTMQLRTAYRISTPTALSLNCPNVTTLKLHWMDFLIDEKGADEWGMNVVLGWFPRVEDLSLKGYCDMRKSHKVDGAVMGVIARVCGGRLRRLEIGSLHVRVGSLCYGLRRLGGLEGVVLDVGWVVGGRRRVEDGVEGVEQVGDGEDEEEVESFDTHGGEGDGGNDNENDDDDEDDDEEDDEPFVPLRPKIPILLPILKSVPSTVRSLEVCSVDVSREDVQVVTDRFTNAKSVKLNGDVFEVEELKAMMEVYDCGWEMNGEREAVGRRRQRYMTVASLFEEVV
ncbi:hypothetical protein HDV00_001925 [Rhizophlyctis rosea]|nr:hypothetical protein HDV00_001925 [Rhizophlyctis rosea]